MKCEACNREILEDEEIYVIEKKGGKGPQHIACDSLECAEELLYKVAAHEPDLEKN